MTRDDLAAGRKRTVLSSPGLGQQAENREENKWRA
jgi:hypothetical protein